MVSDAFKPTGLAQPLPLQAAQSLSQGPVAMQAEHEGLLGHRLIASAAASC